jgi:hypothetical protein
MILHSTPSAASRGIALLFAAVAIAISPGCGKGGPDRFHVSGSVTFSGQPVPVGDILFQPDSSKGNSGPAGFAKIRAGRYDTRVEGAGTMGGPHRVRIAGYDRMSAPEDPPGTTLFADYATSLDLPKADSTQDFTVPPEAGIPPDAGTAGGAAGESER